MSLNNIPSSNIPNSNQLHIGIFGKRNSGKSTLINALTGHNTVKVSAEAGTTTDPIYKSIDIPGIGPCVLIDTAGFDHSSYHEQMRVEKTKLAMQRTDVAIIVCSEDDIAQEIEWAREFKARRAPVIMVINKIDQISNTDKIRKKIFEALKQEPIKISAISKLGIEMVIDEIIHNIPEDYDAAGILGDLVTEGDLVILVMPHHIQAPKGHLSISQNGLIRELLNRECIIISSNIDKFEKVLATLTKPPKLIMLEAQELATVKELLPTESTLITY